MHQDIRLEWAYLSQITLFLHDLPCFNHELLQSIQPSLQALNLLHLCPRCMIQHLIHLCLQRFNWLVIKLYTKQTNVTLYTYVLLHNQKEVNYTYTQKFSFLNKWEFCENQYNESYLNLWAQTNFYPYFPDFFTDLGAIWYVTLLSTCMCFENWCRESHTLLKGTTKLYTYFLHFLSNLNEIWYVRWKQFSEWL